MNQNLAYRLLQWVTMALLCACGSNPQKSNNPTESVDSAEVSYNLLQKERPDREALAQSLDGFWMNDAYLKQIEKTQSVYQSKNKESGWFGIHLEKENLLSNTPHLWAITSHEGGYGFDLYYNSSENRFQGDEPDMHFHTKVNIVPLNPDLMKIEARNGSDSLFYRRTVDIETPLREILFQGSYIALNNPDNHIEFEANGNVSGFEPDTYFEVAYDFGDDVEYDMILISKDEKSNMFHSAQTYKYVFSGDTLFLTRVKTDMDAMEFSLSDSTQIWIKSAMNY